MMRPSARVMVIVQLLMAVCVAGFFIVNRFSVEAKAAMTVSNQAFDQGELKRSVVEARYASYASVPVSSFRQLAIERLLAIALGAEATGRSKTALLAWSSLLATANGASSTSRLRSIIEQQPEQHVGYLLDKVAGASAAGTTRGAAPHRTAMAPATRLPASALACFGLVLGILGIRFGRSTREPAHFGFAVVKSYGLWALAACCWCIGWIIA